MPPSCSPYSRAAASGRGICSPALRQAHTTDWPQRPSSSHSARSSRRATTQVTTATQAANGSSAVVSEPHSIRVRGLNSSSGSGSGIVLLVAAAAVCWPSEAASALDRCACCRIFAMSDVRLGVGPALAAAIESTTSNKTAWHARGSTTGPLSSTDLAKPLLALHTVAISANVFTTVNKFTPNPIGGGCRPSPHNHDERAAEAPAFLNILESDDLLSAPSCRGSRSNKSNCR
eukprot:3509911-Prymnesium_polylepis.2